MVNKTYLAFLFCCLLSFSVQACAKQPEKVAEPKNEAPALPESCELLAENIDKDQFRAAYLPLISKQELLALVDEEHALSENYIPQDLVGTGKERLRQEASQWFKKMQAAAKKDGINLFSVSGYRSYNYQVGLKRRTANPDYVASPGHSQHQLGTAIDFNTVNPKDENIPALRWLRKHAGEYGFSLSFPKGEEEETGYPYEAWHYRYISKEGVELQDKFFGGSQHKMLVFLHSCLWLPQQIQQTQQLTQDGLVPLTASNEDPKPAKKSTSAAKKH